MSTALHPEARLRDLPIAALDFETTGLSPRRSDRVIEVAVVRGRWGETPQRWHTLVNPDRNVAATQIHGITDAMVSSQPRFADIAETLLDQLRGAVVVAHHASFDLSFLEMELSRMGQAMPTLAALDTLGLARRVLALHDHRLATLCARFDLHREHAHRALDDAHATWQLAHHLALAADPTGDLRLGQAQLLSRRRSPSEVDEIIHRLEAARVAGARVTVEYVTSDSASESPIRRPITIVKVTRTRVDAFCHLREADRTFRLDRLRIVADAPTPPRTG